VIRRRLGRRIGTGFLLPAGVIGLDPADELVVLTNFHVVNKNGVNGALTPEAAEVTFEAVDDKQAWPVSAILWWSPEDRHDASVLRLEKTVTEIAPLPVAAALPVVEEDAKVYVIGYPGGQELAFSFQDNKLLDHEGPPAGRPQVPGLCRVHYHAPTEHGSSGSPVFNSDLWEVVALHHKGGKGGMPKLNGKEGSYAANEGISLLSIKGAIQEDAVRAITR
jgi:V8-like Glu-specific endopeptidase